MGGGLLPTEFKFVANQNDEQAITMFVSNLKHRDRKQKERNKSVP